MITVIYSDIECIINDCILVIYYEKNTYDFMHAINSITIITQTATYNSTIN